MKNGIAFPVAYHLQGWISITDFHGGTMPIYVFRYGIKIPLTDYVAVLSRLVV